MLSLLGLAWTLKFLWAPAIDYWRHHRRWMAVVDVAMGFAMLYFAVQSGFGPSVWIAIGVFTALSATNDMAVDGYTIEYLDSDELGLANGIRIGLYRVGMLASGFVLMLSDSLGWPGAFVLPPSCSSGSLRRACPRPPSARRDGPRDAARRGRRARAFAVRARRSSRRSCSPSCGWSTDDEVVRGGARVLALRGRRCRAARRAGRRSGDAPPRLRPLRRRPARRATTRLRAARCSAR